MRWSMTRRVPAGVLAFGLTGLVGIASALGQEFGFRSLGAAERAADRIMEASGLRADFEIVVEPGSDNAAAGIAQPCGRLSGCRVIVYDPEFLLDIERRTDEWGPISIMAHEVAHHLQGHTVFAEGSRPPNELDADFFSGFILQKLGASLESAQAAMRLVASPEGSSSHPPRRERLEYIARGWRRAAADGGAGSGSAREALAEMRAELRRMEERLQDSENRANEAEARVNEAEARAREAQADRGAAEDELRDLRARGNAAEAEVRAAEARVRRASDQVRAAEGQIREAQAARDAAEQDLVQAREENERFGEQAEEAAETADRALLLTVLLVPLVLAALGLSLRRPRREVVRAMDRASQLIRGLRRNSDGSIDRDPSPSPGFALRSSPDPPSPDPPPTPARSRLPVIPAPHPDPVPAPPWFVAAPFARTFDGSGLEQCSEPGGFVLGRDETIVDAVLDHRSVSHRHARLTRLDDGRLCVEDLNSTNGTRVNGRRLEPFALQTLVPGDAVVLGDVDLPLRPLRPA